MRVKVENVTIECVGGDIVRQDGFDAVVNAANAQLLPGGGVAGAIHRGAGPGLVEECRPLAPIQPGQAVITTGCALPNPYVIHSLGPVYGVDEPADRLLGDCYRNALQLADEKGLSSIAFPAISTGAFGYPIGAAARVALGAVLELTTKLVNIRRIRFVLLGKNDLEIHEKVLKELL